MEKREKGQTSLIFALLIVALLVFIALAVDGGMLYVSRRNAQSAADSAAFAGALALTRGADYTTAALGRAADNGFNNDLITNWVTVNHPPASGQYQGNPNYIQVLIRARIQTSFIQLVYPGAAESTSEAVVEFTAASPAGGPNALIGLSPTDCDTVLVDGNMDVTIAGGGIFSNSNAGSGSCYAMRKLGSSGNILVSGGDIEVVGRFYNASPSSVINPTPLEGAAPVVPLIFTPPDCTCGKNLNGPACSNADVSVQNSTLLGPGIYHNITLDTSSAQLTMDPGLYCINGDFTASGGAITGNGVTIVMNGGSLDLSGDVSVQLSGVVPPQAAHNDLISTDGSTYDYLGLLIFADPSLYNGVADSHTLKIGGSNGNSFTGTVYAPKTMCTLSGTGGTVVYYSQVYCDTLTVSGNANINLSYNPSQNWAVPPRLDLMK